MVLNIKIKSAKNGKTNLLLLLDTNIIVDFLKSEDEPVDLFSLISQHDCFTSVIVKLEMLKHPTITPSEENIINEFFQFIPVVSINTAIEKETISISRVSKLKLPDAIIGATAIVYGAEIVTRDQHFLNCRYDKLRIWGSVR